jgi:hypothetical protein
MYGLEKILISAISTGGAIVGEKTISIEESSLDYEQCTRMILDIGSQIEILRENGLGILYLSLEDITAMKDGSYLLTPKIDPFSCDEKGMILIDRPFIYNSKIMAPELKTINCLPSNVFYTSSYYSLKNIVVKSMKIDNIQNIYPSKLFFLIERCSDENPTNRVFLFV